MQYIKEYHNFGNNFKKWFSNSKVIDENNEPLIVYHGTSEDFDIFNTDNQNFKISKLGYYFTNAPTYSYENKYKKFVPGSTASEYAFNSQKKGYSELDGANVIPVYLSIQNPLYIDADGWYSDITAIDKQVSDIKRWLKEGDYDGIISRYTDKNSDDYIENTTYVVFNKNQIKSAIGNNGDYSKNNSILEYNYFLNNPSLK